MTLYTWHWTGKHHFYTKNVFSRTKHDIPFNLQLDRFNRQTTRLKHFNPTWTTTASTPLTSPHYTPTYVHITTLLTPLLLATRCLICLIVTGTIDLTLTIWLKTVTFLRMAILFTSRQAVSLWVVTIIDK